MYNSIADIKRANRTLSHSNGRAYWFEPGTMSFFGTQLHDKVYFGQYFITSEQYLASDYGKTYLGFTDGPRMYSVRVCHADGSIDTIGEHMGYKSLEEAEQSLRKLM